MATPSDFTGTTTTKTVNMVIYDDHHIDLLYHWVSHAICVYISLPLSIYHFHETSYIKPLTQSLPADGMYKSSITHFIQILMKEIQSIAYLFLHTSLVIYVNLQCYIYAATIY